MNEIVNKFLLAGDKFIPEIHLRQPGFTYSACRSFTKNKNELRNSKKKEIQDISIKTRFHHDMACGDLKGLNRGIFADKMIKHLMRLKMQNMMDANVDLLQWFVNFLRKKTSGSVIKDENISKKELVEKLQKRIIRKFTLTFYWHYLGWRFSRHAVNT